MSTVTVIDELKKVLNESDVDAFTDAEIMRYIADNIIGDETTYTFIKKGTSVQDIASASTTYVIYKYTGHESYHFLYPASPFTETGGVTYILNSNGTILAVGSETRDAITVTATRVNFPKIVVGLLNVCKTRIAGEGDSKLGGGVSQKQAELERAIEHWQGVYSVG